MIRAGVVGSPISHSLSPLFHNAWLNAAGIDGLYEAYEPGGRFGDFIEAHRELSGLNVTIPFKLDALTIADKASTRASRAGAANLLVFERDGSIVADNTDGEGLLAAFAEQAPGFEPEAGPVMILGAGGAARGAAAAFVEAGCPQVRIVNRSADKARNLCDLLGDRVVVSDDLRAVSAVINATSLGLNGGDGPSMELASLPSAAVIMDMVYRPLETAFLARARAAGHRTVDGLAMLIGQARPSFAALFGQAPPAGVDVRARVPRRAGASAVILVGLTGSIGMGKSTTTRMFADAGAHVYDADAEVHRLYTENASAIAKVEAAFPGRHGKRRGRSQAVGRAGAGRSGRALAPQRHRLAAHGRGSGGLPGQGARRSRGRGARHPAAVRDRR